VVGGPCGVDSSFYDDISTSDRSPCHDDAAALRLTQVLCHERTGGTRPRGGTLLRGSGGGACQRLSTLREFAESGRRVSPHLGTRRLSWLSSARPLAMDGGVLHSASKRRETRREAQLWMAVFRCAGAALWCLSTPGSSLTSRRFPVFDSSCSVNTLRQPWAFRARSKTTAWHAKFVGARQPGQYYCRA